MAKTEPLRTEQEHHKRAFALYAGAGTSRSYRAVARQMDVSASTIKLWAKSFHWQEHLREREAEQTRQLADRTFHGEAAEVGRNLKIVRAALIRLAKGIADGKLKMQMGDLDRLIRLEEHLIGRPDPELLALLQHPKVRWLMTEKDPAKIRAFLRESCPECRRRAKQEKPRKEETPPTHEPDQPSSD